MLTVVTPATSFRLTTWSRLERMLDLGDLNATAEGALAADWFFIDQASRAVADYCRRSFGQETVRETFAGSDLKGDGALLARSPVTDIANVTSDGVTLLASEYTYDQAAGRLYRTDAPWWPGCGLSVEYTAGYVLPEDNEWHPTLPESVERATVLLVQAYLSARSHDSLVKSEDVAGVTSTAWWVPGANDALPSPEAERLLQPYRRIYP
jgi:hypothetical protein